MLHSTTLKNAYNYLAWTPVTISRKTYQIIKQVDNSGSLAKHLLAQTSLTLISNYFKFGLYQNISTGFGQMDSYIFGKLADEEATEQDWNDFKNVTISLLPPVFYYIGFSLIVNTVETIYDQWFSQQIRQKFNAKVFGDNQIGIQLANDSHTAAIVRNVGPDAEVITKSGLSLIKDAVKSAQDAFLSISSLYNLSSKINILGFKVPDLILYSGAFSVGRQIISSFFTTKLASMSADLTTQQVRTDAIISHDLSNVKPIFFGSNHNITAERHAEEIRKTDKMNLKYRLFHSVYSVWERCTRFANNIFKYAVMGGKVYNKTILKENIYSAFDHFNNVDNLLNWAGDNQDRIKKLGPVLGRLQTFLDHEKNIIQQPKKVRFSENNQTLNISNLSLGLDSKPLIKVTDMFFKPGERYVISGEKGLGKSSLIAKLNGIVHDGIDAEGAIWYPAGVNKMMLTQDEYFPLHATLLDIICLPNKVPQGKEEKAKIRAEATRLLEEANIGRELNLEQEKPNWASELSGGQKKIIKIVSALINKPNVLFLDEVFSGLDHQSKNLLQGLINKYLPDTIIISVDHYPDDSPDFYTSHHSIQAGTLKHEWGTEAINTPQEKEHKSSESEGGFRQRVTKSRELSSSQSMSH
jgi:ABC-type uncharacterized transport system fused permease/ATPase subunit